MKARTVLFPALLLAIGVLALHIRALQDHLYFHNPWFHVVIHFVAGFAISLTTVFVLHRLRPDFPVSRKMFMVVLSVVFLFALGWEIFEYTNGLIYVTGVPYFFDTLRDIAVGLIGGAFGLWYAVSMIEKHVA